MANKALYILAGYDNDTEQYLAGIQNKLYENGFVGTQTKNIPMHTTLGSFPTDKEDELVAFLKQLSSETQAFDVTFNHVGIFSGERVLFVAPDASFKLLELKEKGKTVIISTHIFNLIEKLCDRVGILIKGQMVTCDTLEKVCDGISLEDRFFALYEAAEGGEEA